MILGQLKMGEHQIICGALLKLKSKSSLFRIKWVSFLIFDITKQKSHFWEIQLNFLFINLEKLLKAKILIITSENPPPSPFLVKNNNNFLSKLYWYITGGPILGNPFEIPFLKLGKIVQSQTTCNHFRESPPSLHSWSKIE